MSNYKKTILSHSRFYIAQFQKNPDLESLIFIHGGPGNNCGIIEFLIEQECFFQSLNYNIVLYDQRACGRSKNNHESVYHNDNIDDLYEIYHYLSKQKITIKGFIAHSYGAKLLFDFYKKTNNPTPGVFVSTANSILIPRLNNLLFDLAYLKETNTTRYKEIFMKMDYLNPQKIWQLTDDLSEIFQNNKQRLYLYWANLNWLEKVQKIQKVINLPANDKIFMSVRKDLYRAESNFSIEIDQLKIPYLWINGFHDFIINGAMAIQNPCINLLYKSAHYPHIEEHQHFCELINEFFKNMD